MKNIWLLQYKLIRTLYTYYCFKKCDCFVKFWIHIWMCTIFFEESSTNGLFITYTVKISICKRQKDTKQQIYEINSTVIEITLVSLRFVTLYTTATWIPFKIPLLWLIQQWSPIVFFCHLRCRVLQRDKSQTHYCLVLTFIVNLQTMNTLEVIDYVMQ